MGDRRRRARAGATPYPHETNARAMRYFRVVRVVRVSGREVQEDVRTRGSAASSCQATADKIKEGVCGRAAVEAAMAAPVASVSPRSAAAFSRGAGVCSATRICCLPPRGSSAKIVLSPSELRGSVTRRRRLVPRSSTSDSQATKQEKAPFGYTRKDVLLIGLGVTAFGVGLKSGLEFLGVDPLQAGNVVQLLVVLGMTVGWISTYMFRVANKDMTYAHQLRDYEKQVMEKRLESLSEAELQALLEQVEEEKQRMPAVPDEPNAITFNKK